MFLPTQAGKKKKKQDQTDLCGKSCILSQQNIYNVEFSLNNKEKEMGTPLASSSTLLSAFPKHQENIEKYQETAWSCTAFELQCKSNNSTA